MSGGGEEYGWTAAEKASRILEILFPDGVDRSCLNSFGFVTQIVHKLVRYCESFKKVRRHRDSIRDLAGYALLLASRELDERDVE